MALVVQSERILTHPTEKVGDAPAEFVLRLPLTAGDLAHVQAGRETLVDINLDMLAAALVRWPYPEPISNVSVRQLDTATYIWLLREVNTASGIEEDEKNASGSSSPAITAPGVEHSQPNSGTS